MTSGYALIFPCSLFACYVLQNEEFKAKPWILRLPVNTH